MDTLKLIAAIAYIQLNLLQRADYVISIRFEDGSLSKFNYKSSFGENHFIDLTGKI